MAPQPDQRLPLRDDQDLLKLRKRVRDVIVEIHLSPLEQTKLATAVSELGRNVIKHGGGGEARVELVEDRGAPAIRVTFEDRGVGIAELELAMTDGFSTGKGLGLGLGGSRRLVDHFEIRSAANEGTVVTILKRGRR